MNTQRKVVITTTYNEMGIIIDTKAEEVVQPDTTTHDSIPAKTGKNDGDSTSGDCVSRQQAIDALKEKVFHNLSDEFYGAMQVLDELPSIQPERNMGHWIPDNTDYYRTKFICSACGESEEVPTTGFGYGTMWDYCPMCGAKMEGGEHK